MSEHTFSISTTEVLAVDDERIYVEKSGSGDPLLLIQGLGYATWAWESQAPLADSNRLIAFDNRGSGRSSKPEGRYSIELMAEDAARVIEENGSKPANVLGVSMGGYIAQELALARPDLVSALILVSTSAGGPGHEPVPESTLTAWMAAADLPPAEYARSTMRLSFASGWVENHPGEYERWLDARLEYPTPAGCWRAQFEACEVFLDVGAAVERIIAPTLIIHGQDDRVLPVSNAHELDARIPHSRLVICPGLGHLHFIEDPQSFNRTVLDFLAGVVDS